MENEYGILEVDVGPNGELDEETEKFILEKVKEAVDENIWYTQEEVIEALDKLEKENNNTCIKSFILGERK